MDKVDEVTQQLENCGISDGKKKQSQVLSTLDLRGVVEYIKSGKVKNVITMCGAGISTSAGIPDFRSPNSGLYAKLAAYDLPYPEAVFTLDYFKQKPEAFYKLTKELWPTILKPTPTHYFITLLHEKGLLLRHYTQNIDGLEFVAALPPEKIVEAHGSFRTSRCLKCNKEYSIDWVYERAVDHDEVPKCNEAECDGVVKPDVVFFGEALPKRFFDCVNEDFSKCDLLIVIGTSLTVQPFASLVQRVPKDCPRLLINREKVGSSDSDFIALLMGGGSSLRFDEKDNYRDVFYSALCDEGCRDFAKLLGWNTELEKRITEQHELLDKCPVKPYTAPQQLVSNPSETNSPKKAASSKSLKKSPTSKD